MLSRGILLQRTTRLISKPSSSKFTSSARVWLENLFASNVPKGFGKYYPKGNGGTSSGAGKSAGAGKSTGEFDTPAGQSSVEDHLTLFKYYLTSAALLRRESKQNQQKQ